MPCKRGESPHLVQDQRWPHLYRIHWPDGVISGPANLTRCKDAYPRMKRIESWLNTRILELRSKIDQLKRYKPSNRIGGRMREFQLAHYEGELAQADQRSRDLHPCHCRGE
jgi:hypothetical protein